MFTNNLKSLASPQEKKVQTLETLVETLIAAFPGGLILTSGENIIFANKETDEIFGSEQEMMYD